MRHLNFSGEEILETITMVRTEQLDIRTITVGISLLDCVSDNPDTLCRNVYEKIERGGAQICGGSAPRFPRNSACRSSTTGSR